MQMYKVFFNDRSIILGSKPENFSENHPHSFYVEDENQLIVCVAKFIDNEAVKHVFIYADDPEKIFRSFKKLFHRIDAAGGIVRNNNGDYLVIKRLGLWDLPKGKLEKGEKKKEGAMREVIEECGLSKVEITGKLPSTWHSYTRKGKRMLKRTYWYEMYSEDVQLTPQTEEDITEVRWVPLKEMNQILENTYMSIKNILEDYIQKS